MKEHSSHISRIISVGVPSLKGSILFFIFGQNGVVDPLVWSFDHEYLLVYLVCT
jgi:hypothetical protein